MSKRDYMKLFKYVVGSVTAILLAAVAHLEFAYAAGIITLLTIQDTKKETMKIACKRVIIFIVMTFLSVVIFSLTDFHVWAFGLVLIPYLYCCMAFDMKEAIAPIAVLCTHYISAKSCSISMIANEFGILIIGAGVGIVLNLFVSKQDKALIASQNRVDQKIILIIQRMAIYIEKDEKSDYTKSCFRELELLLEDLKKESLLYKNNHFRGEIDYYYAYMLMRTRQCNLLKNIYEDIIRIHMVPVQAKALADFLRKVADEFSEENDASELRKELADLTEHYTKEQLPVTRMEFESRAMLFHILKDMDIFLEIKEEYCQNVT